MYWQPGLWRQQYLCSFSFSESIVPSSLWLLKLLALAGICGSLVTHMYARRTTCLTLKRFLERFGLQMDTATANSMCEFSHLWTVLNGSPKQLVQAFSGAVRLLERRRRPPDGLFAWEDRERVLVNGSCRRYAAPASGGLSVRLPCAFPVFFIDVKADDRLDNPLAGGEHGWLTLLSLLCLLHHTPCQLQECTFNL